MTRKTYLLGALVAALAGAFTGTASAEDLSASKSVATPAAEENDADDDESTHPMGWIGIGAKIGVAGNGEGEFEVGGLKTTIKSRTGFNIAVPINMGGDGFGWLIEPYLNLASVDGTDATGKAKSYGVTTFGAFTGPVVNIHIIDPLYVGVGAGLKVGYAKSDAFDVGADVFGRVPVSGTYYFMNDVAAVLELGLGYGMTGFAAKPYTTVDPATMTPKVVEPKLEFGSALTWDVSAGIRWP